MRVLAIDIGSSAVRAAILSGRDSMSKVARVPFETIFDGPRAEVEASAILNSLTKCIAQLGSAIRTVDLIAPAVMSPSWVALDRKGNALTKVITHQDRRSVQQAIEIEEVVGRKRHMHLTGNRPIPGGISSTTWLWHLQRSQSQMRRAKVVGHLSTMLAYILTGKRIVDPSNASFMGLYITTNLSTWSDELIESIGIDRAQLPEIIEANSIAGTITASASEKFGLKAGTPMLAGIMDGSCAMLLAGAEPGQLVNVCGSTDVLALCVDRAKPHTDFLTRALGVGKRWLAVQTIAAAGNALGGAVTDTGLFDWKS
ncbi:MAG TPA: FGGY family carbohydrate kinase, partial [Tepidisphaeraceae bacterium]|nr:FGGY family carbohydrate kinase [Tepidisphaeraceae bacterium]